MQRLRVSTCTLIGNFTARSLEGRLFFLVGDNRAAKGRATISLMAEPADAKDLKSFSSNWSPGSNPGEANY